MYDWTNDLNQATIDTIISLFLPCYYKREILIVSSTMLSDETENTYFVPFISAK